MGGPIFLLLLAPAPAPGGPTAARVLLIPTAAGVLRIDVAPE